MSSVINIWNMALRKAGAQPVLSADEIVTPDSEQARVCSEFYAAIRDAVFRAYPWNSAISRATLAKETASPDFEWDYQYPLPADCLRVLQMENPLSEWRVERRKLLTDETEAKIIYIARVVDPASWDPLLVRAVYTALAAECAIALSKDPALSERLLNEVETVILPQARKFDAQESASQQLVTRTLLDARHERRGSLLQWP